MRYEGVCYSSPIRFTLRQRAALACIGPAATGVMRANHVTHRTEVIGAAHLENLVRTRGQLLLAIWHEVLGMAITHHAGAGFHTLTSYSYDGELAARIVRWSGLEACRGSSSRGGGEGLAELVKAGQKGASAGLTLDGPRGPRRESKPGIALLSARTGIPILPNAFAAAPAWRMRSWDRFYFPKPFAHVVCAYSEPIMPPADESPESIEATRAETERALRELTANIESRLGVSE